MNWIEGRIPSGPRDSRVPVAGLKRKSFLYNNNDASTRSTKKSRFDEASYQKLVIEGLAHMRASEYSDAHRCFQLVVEHSDECPPHLVASAWDQLGAVFIVVKNPTEAIKCYRNACLFREGGGVGENPSTLAYASRFSQLGSALFQSKKHHEAVKYHEAELHNLLCGGAAVVELVCQVYSDMPGALKSTNGKDHKRARVYQYYASWLTVLLGDGWRTSAPATMACRQSVIIGVEDTVLRPAAEEVAAMQSTMHGLKCELAAWRAMSQGPESAKYFAQIVKKVVSTARPVLVGLARATNNLANAYVGVSKMEPQSVCPKGPEDAEVLARQMFRACMVLNELTGQAVEMAKASVNLGVVLQHSTDARSEAGEYYERGIDTLEKSSDVLTCARAMGNYGGYLLQMGDLTKARSVLDRAVQRCEDSLAAIHPGAQSDGWKASVLSVLEGCYTNLVVCHAEAGRHRDALLVAEKGRSRTMADRTEGLQVPSVATAGLTVEEMEQSAHATGTALVEYAVVSVPGSQGPTTEIFTWVVTSEGGLRFTRKAVSSILSQESMRGKVDASLCTSLGTFVRGLQDMMTESVHRQSKPHTGASRPRTPAAMHHMLYALYKLLVSDVEDCLRFHKHIVFFPHKDLWLVPFHALYCPPMGLRSFGVNGAQHCASDTESDSEANHAPPTRGVYLMERFSSTMCPSMALFVRSIGADTAGPAAPTKTLLVGNPTSSKTSLRHAELEVQFVANKVASPGDLLVGPHATKEEVLSRLDSGLYNHVHLATHGSTEPSLGSLAPASTLADGQPPARDGLRGSPAQQSCAGNGVLLNGDVTLVAADVADLKLGHVALAVLSSCESGAGETNADGVMGLVKGLMCAGVARTVASLWSVDDLAATMFMIKFYSLLCDKHCRSFQCAHAALQQTRQWMLRVTLSEILETYDACLSEATGLRQGGGDVPALLQMCSPQQREYLQGCAAQIRPFSSPGHWAAFTQVGFGCSPRCDH